MLIVPSTVHLAINLPVLVYQLFGVYTFKGDIAKWKNSRCFDEKVLLFVYYLCIYIYIHSFLNNSVTKGEYYYFFLL